MLQTDLELPPLEKLCQALLAVPGLVALDAQIILRDAFGILFREQTQEKTPSSSAGCRRTPSETENLVSINDASRMKPMTKRKQSVVANAAVMRCEQLFQKTSCSL